MEYIARELLCLNKIETFTSLKRTDENKLGFSILRVISQLAPKVVFETLNLETKRESCWKFGVRGTKDMDVNIYGKDKRVPNVTVRLISWTRENVEM